MGASTFAAERDPAGLAPVFGTWWVEDEDASRREYELLVRAEECHPCAGTPLEQHVRALRQGIGGDIDG